MKRTTTAGFGFPQRIAPTNDDARSPRIATRYDKLAANYLAFVKLASIQFGCVLESTP